MESALSHPLSASGLPSLSSLTVRTHFISSVDPRTRTPAWVLEDLGLLARRPARDGEVTRAESRFFEDGERDPGLRARLADYVGSGFDRGHLAASADAIWLRASQAEHDESFILSNIIPQDPQLNRHYWARMEKFARKLRHPHVYVTSGPLYIPEKVGDRHWELRHRVIGQDQTPPVLAVPTHCFKAILLAGEDEPGHPVPRAVACFVVPNKPIPEDTPLETFLTPIEEVERLAGFRLFPALLHHQQVLDAGAGGDEAAKPPLLEGLCTMEKCQLPPGWTPPSEAAKKD
jgi:endonuclease G